MRASLLLLYAFVALTAACAGPRSDGPAESVDFTGLNGFTADEWPRPVRTVPPEYPAAALRAGLSGAVVLKVYVLPDGRPGQIEVAQSAGEVPYGAAPLYDRLGRPAASGPTDGPLFDRAAVAAVSQWTFTPARHRGRVVPAWVLVPVRFRTR